MKKGSGRGLATFLQKTYTILTEESAPEIIGWTESGDAFYVKDVEAFEQTILPKYFKHSKFSSFVRQLNTYDFHKIRSSTDDHQVFRHGQFQRGKPDLLKSIQRKNPQVDEDSEFMDPPNRRWLALEMRRLERKQQDLEQSVETMEQHSLDIVTKNNTMLNQIIYYKERETRIEKLLVMFASYIQSLHKRKDMDPGLAEFLAFFRKPQDPVFYHDLQSRGMSYKRPKPELTGSEEFDESLSAKSDDDPLELLLRSTS